MKDEKSVKLEKLRDTLGILNVIFIAASFAGCVYIIATQILQYKIIGAAALAALIAGFSYIIRGYEKDAAKYYKAYMLIASFSNLTMICCSCAATGKTIDLPSVIMFGFLIIVYGNFMMMGFAKELGRKINCSLSIANCAVWAVIFILTLIINTSAFGDICIYFTFFTISSLALLMTIAKYMDKAERDTK